MRSRHALLVAAAACLAGACHRNEPAISDSSATSGTPSAVAPSVAPSPRNDSSATSGTPMASGTKRDSLRRADSLPRPTKKP